MESAPVNWIGSPNVGDLEPIAEMLNRWYAGVIPGERPAPAEELEAAINRAPAYQESHLAVVEDGRDVLGAALLITEDLEGRRNDAHLDFLLVLPEARGRGVGRALVDAAAARARDKGRTRLTCSSVAGDAAADAFARSLKAEAELLEQQNRASTAGMDADLLRLWVRRSQERAQDYSLISSDGALPDELRAEFARLNQVMNTAPHGPNLEDLIMSPADLDECRRAFDDQGYRRWTVIARHDPSGALVGFTELMFSPFRPWMAFQWDTGVDTGHRNLGLGRWMKAVNALRVLDELPDVEQIETWNAASNASMLGINRAMGFEAVAEWQSWEMPV